MCNCVSSSNHLKELKNGVELKQAQKYQSAPTNGEPLQYLGAKLKDKLE